MAARGEDQLRPHIEDGARQIMASIDAGGPEVLPDLSEAETDRGHPAPALASPASMARLRATFVDSHDGRVDDNIAFTQPWGFDLGGITVLVSIWFGSRDERSRKHGNWLLRRIPTADAYEYPGGHLQDDSAYRQMLTWLRG